MGARGRPHPSCWQVLSRTLPRRFHTCLSRLRPQGSGSLTAEGLCGWWTVESKAGSQASARCFASPTPQLLGSSPSRQPLGEQQAL